jgi:hypothetical protein
MKLAQSQANAKVAERAALFFRCGAKEGELMD